MPIAPILVAAAGGTVGRHVAAALAAQGVPVRAMVRRAPPPGEAATPGVAFVAADFDRPASLAGALAGVERCFLASPSTPAMERQQRDFLDAARRAGVRRVVKVSVPGASPETPMAVARAHAAVEAALRGAGFEATMVLRPTYFMQNAAHLMGLAGDDGAVPLPFGAARPAQVDARDVGLVAARLLLAPHLDADDFLLTGPEAIPFEDCFAALGRAVGRPLRYVPAEADAFRAHAARRGLPPILVEHLVELGLALAAEAPPTGAVEAVLGRRPAPLGDYLAREAQALRTAGAAPGPAGDGGRR